MDLKITNRGDQEAELLIEMDCTDVFTTKIAAGCFWSYVELGTAARVIKALQDDNKALLQEQDELVKRYVTLEKVAEAVKAMHELGWDISAELGNALAEVERSHK